MVSKSFWIKFFGSLRYRIISSANRDIFIDYLLICIPFISSSCLIALARNSSTMLNKSGDSGHPCPDFRGNSFSFSLLIMMLAVDLSHIGFTMLRYILSIPSFLIVLHEVVLDFIKGFFCIYWDDQVVFVLASINVLCYIYWFSYVEPLLHPRDEADLVVVNDLSDVLSDSVCHYLIEDFCIDIH
jgi:hypothetical protein